MQLEIGKLLICPAGTPNTPDKTFEMGEIHALEARQQEIATVSKVTAPELMQAFINGYGHSSRTQIQLEWELTQALKHLEERRAVVNLDIAPAYLQEKGLTRPSNPAGSEDQRKSVLAKDKEYGLLQDRVAMIEAATEYLKTKTKSFEMSYQSVKKVYDSLSSINALTNGAARQVTGGGASPYVSPDEPSFPAPNYGIGKPRY